MRWLLWCFCLLVESYETINHWPLIWVFPYKTGLFWGGSSQYRGAISVIFGSQVSCCFPNCTKSWWVSYFVDFRGRLPQSLPPNPSLGTTHTALTSVKRPFTRIYITTLIQDLFRWLLSRNKQNKKVVMERQVNIEAGTMSSEKIRLWADHFYPTPTRHHRQSHFSFFVTGFVPLEKSKKVGLRFAGNLFVCEQTRSP